MIEKLKTYVLTVALNKYLPMAGMAAIAALGTFLAAHQGMLEPWGITYGTWPLSWATTPTGPCIVIELDTLSAKAFAGVAALVVAIIAGIQHHTTPVPSSPEAPPKGLV